MIYLLLAAGAVLLVLSQGKSAPSADSPFTGEDYKLEPGGQTARLTASGYRKLKAKLEARKGAPMIADNKLVGIDLSAPTPAGATESAYWILSQALSFAPTAFAAMTSLSQQGTTNESLRIYLFTGGSVPAGMTYLGNYAELKQNGVFWQ
jgi:hypothetical protein